MEGEILGLMVIGLLLGSVVGGFIMNKLAKEFTLEDDFSLVDSVRISMVVSVINFLVWCFLLIDDFSKFFIQIFVLDLIFVSVAYFVVIKIFWEYNERQSVKLNIMWITIYALLVIYTFYQLEWNDFIVNAIFPFKILIDFTITHFF